MAGSESDGENTLHLTSTGGRRLNRKVPVSVILNLPCSACRLFSCDLSVVVDLRTLVSPLKLYRNTLKLPRRWAVHQTCALP